MDNKSSFKELIKSDIERDGYHITLVAGGVEPRFAYSIGLDNEFNFELVFAGGVYYLKEEMLKVFREIAKRLRSREDTIGGRVILDSLGEFSFLPVHSSWSKRMLLGVYDYYHTDDVRAYQIIPDASHFTYDIPDMSKEWNPVTEPVWQWLDRKWDYDVSKISTVVTNIGALQGEPITELMRWENDEWEMFAGAGPDVRKEDMRIVSLGTILGIDESLLPSIHLEIGKGLWREDRESEWKNWG